VPVLSKRRCAWSDVMLLPILIAITTFLASS